MRRTASRRVPHCLVCLLGKLTRSRKPLDILIVTPYFCSCLRRSLGNINPQFNRKRFSVSLYLFSLNFDERIFYCVLLLLSVSLAELEVRRKRKKIVMGGDLNPRRSLTAMWVHIAQCSSYSCLFVVRFRRGGETGSTLIKTWGYLPCSYLYYLLGILPWREKLQLWRLNDGATLMMVN